MPLCPHEHDADPIYYIAPSHFSMPESLLLAEAQSLHQAKNGFILQGPYQWQDWFGMQQVDWRGKHVKVIPVLHFVETNMNMKNCQKSMFTLHACMLLYI